MDAALYPLSPAWNLVALDLGISTANVLRRVGLSADLLHRDPPLITAAEYSALFVGFSEESGDPTLAIRAANALSFEMFDAPIFAAMCSPNLSTALDRMKRYKRLCSPILLHLDASDVETVVTIEWREPTITPPEFLFTMDLAYYVRLARLGTRRAVRARRITTPYPLEPLADFTAFFGVRPVRGPSVSVAFDAADTTAAFLTENTGMWQMFEPILQRRAAELDEATPVSERARAALTELLPIGETSIQAVAKRLAMSVRTLQRKLHAEGRSFQRVLDMTRAQLARHYLQTSALTGTEIAFLLGFEDPRSFGRAFREWTGQTPEQLRSSLSPVRAGAAG